MCSICIEGYSLNISGKNCICDTAAGFKQFSDSPIKCGNNVLRCANYIEGDTQFTCSSCIEGYTYDILGKSCICAEGYVKVVNNPIECTIIIDNCITFFKLEGKWICEVCSTGYKVDIYGKCFN
jgi:hypothetical protein